VLPTGPAVLLAGLAVLPGLRAASDGTDGSDAEDEA